MFEIRSSSRQEYSDIFKNRGHLYHKAMVDFPKARDREFENVARLAKVRGGQSVIDVPSGGGYLKGYLPETCRLRHIEICKDFLPDDSAQNSFSMVKDLCQLPVDSHQFHVAVSIAALHHVRNRRRFFQEMRRVLKKTGRLIIADVEVDSPQASFLNEFVDNFNSMGHEGWFIDSRFEQTLEDTGFEILSSEDVNGPWIFPSVPAMIDYSRNLFGLDLASDERCREGLARYLGFHEVPEGIELNWQLRMIVAQVSS